MKIRLIPLLVLTVVLFTAPAAFATHCVRCSFAQPSHCIVSINLAGFEFCWEDEEGCHVETACSPHGGGLAPEPLAAEFSVASVERLDEPEAKTADTLVASLETQERTER